MTAIWQALTHTPWWVYVLFFYLLKVGVDATKSNTVSLKKLFVLPSAFFLISLNTLINSVQPTVANFSIYTLALGVGVSGGWILVKNMALQFDKNKELIRLSGSWATLLLILTIFTAKYYFGYSLAIDPSLSEDTLFELSMLAVSGVCTGMLIGRLACYLYRRKNSPHQELVEE